MTEALNQLAAADELLAATRATRVERRDNVQLEALALAVSANLPVLLWGEPGIGKSSALQQLADRLAVPMETVIASIHEPSDFAGLPVVGDDPATQGVPMAPPDWAVRLTRSGIGLVFFDELSSAPPAVQAALLRVVLERRVGSLELPPGVRVVAAANPPASAADGWHLSPPLANRFVHLHWTHDPEVVARGLAGTWPTADIPRIDPRRAASALARARGTLSGFLTARPGLSHHMPSDAEARGGAWPSPRTWEMALRLLTFALASNATREALATALVGAIGDGAGLEFITYLEELDLPDPNRVLADPGAFALPERGDRQLAFLTAVVSAVQSNPSRPRWEAAWTVLAKAVDAGVPDVAARAATDLAAMRDKSWPVPPTIDAFVDILRLSGAMGR
ncbi:AAA family ATPase [Dactylosporangium matsuzakiense]|uniref:ATPase AAA n=1 Tax=Dactylosporangium matsuzakiense TaxID=53360 RepID=A0A9W6NM64_9ACTN|nr:AAA family ATPase [Dactylosporangium matsuzakiense]UWZ43211.1 AAA family ATPase [Dactylosporangium matsuzakiense]GLL02695.1 ATPase AAA [Dactylosporangium matsuzakiense]